MRSMRPRQSVLELVERAVHVATAPRRPCGPAAHGRAAALTTSPARSSTATCFCTAAKLIG